MLSSPLPLTHVPVLAAEVLSVLCPREGDRVLDLTLGLGGHARAMRAAIGSSGLLIGLDADVENLALARANLGDDSSLQTVCGNFKDLPDVLPSGVRCFDVILADLGLSSPHVDDPSRGFTYRVDAPLDMRFSRDDGETAARVLQADDPKTLRRIFLEYGELSHVDRLVSAIVQRRSSQERITSSADLVAVVRSVYGSRADRVMPCVFQALRMHVNRELDALAVLLREAPLLLTSGGRLGIISYHSLEDRMVKRAFKSLTTAPRDPVTGADTCPSDFERLTQKPLKPSADEVERNPRSRSAVFRAVRRIS